MSTFAALPRRALLKLTAAFAVLPATPRRSWARPTPVTLTFDVPSAEER